MHRRVAAADASDPDFWHRVALDELELVMLALTNHQENMLVAKLLEELGYKGRVAAVVRFAEEAEALEARGISAFNLYAQAGEGFAAHAAQGLRERRQHNGIGDALSADDSDTSQRDSDTAGDGLSQTPLTP
jgi:glutathione-regulated potassium-efflux system ancillary protein KefC